MISVLVMSHGRMADGMVDSCKLFFGEGVEKVKALCLLPTDDPEQFDERIRAAVSELDDGSGVVAFCDLLGGTPSNRSMYVVAENPNVKVVTGMSLTMLLELLGRRLMVENVSELDLDELMNVGKDGITCLNKMFEQ